MSGFAIYELRFTSDPRGLSREGIPKRTERAGAVLEDGRRAGGSAGHRWPLHGHGLGGERSEVTEKTAKMLPNRIKFPRFPAFFRIFPRSGEIFFASLAALPFGIVRIHLGFPIYDLRAIGGNSAARAFSGNATRRTHSAKSFAYARIRSPPFG
jgi:hypothetical protein